MESILSKAAASTALTGNSVKRWVSTGNGITSNGSASAILLPIRMEHPLPEVSKNHKVAMSHLHKKVHNSKANANEAFKESFNCHLKSPTKDAAYYTRKMLNLMQQESHAKEGYTPFVLKSKSSTKSPTVKRPLDETSSDGSSDSSPCKKLKGEWFVFP